MQTTKKGKKNPMKSLGYTFTVYFDTVKCITFTSGNCFKSKPSQMKTNNGDLDH